MGGQISSIGLIFTSTSVLLESLFSIESGLWGLRETFSNSSTASPQRTSMSASQVASSFCGIRFLSTTSCSKSFSK